MISTDKHNQPSIMTRTRQAHRKSRTGCFACKRRKAKCDELKPGCTRCKKTLQKCCYPPIVLSGSHKPAVKLPLTGPRDCGDLSASHSSSFPGDSMPLVTSTRSNPAGPKTECCYDVADAALQLSDADLYHHYLAHTSHTLSHCHREQDALQRGIPALASQSKTVFHSLLALSAVCLCCDMISKDPPPSLDAVNQVLMTGYRLYNLASEQMRKLMSQPNDFKTEPLLASALLLVPFTAASQQINHWISSKTTTQKLYKPLSSTPRDVLIMMRGIRTTLQALDYHRLTTPQTIECAANSSSPMLGCNISTTLPPSRTHTMFPILASTSQKAFCKLQKRLVSLCYGNACYGGARSGKDQLSACATALDILLAIRNEAFSISNSSTPSSLEAPIETFLEPDLVSLPNVGPWLRSYTSRHAISRPTEPLTMRFLGFLIEAPQSYLDLVLPLLDQRLERPIDTSSDDTWAQLTQEQALALDIYAHWSVLMILVEEESWWIGNLPFVTLTGMVNRYGDQFVTSLLPGDTQGQEQWWPGCMVNILRELKRCR